MRFDELLRMAGDLPFFDLALVVQISGDRKDHLLVQLHRWARAGKVVSLRRGLYTLSATYRRVSLSPLVVANQLCTPSYLSGAWVLSFYGLIPEKVTIFTNITPRVTRSFRNALGEFTYSNVKQDFFWGLMSREIQGSAVWIAEPEKALLDFWHLHHGEWTEDRMIEMRFQNHDSLDFSKLEYYGHRWGSPRLLRAVRHYRQVQEASGAGDMLI